jgi:hypothetical protein
LRGPGTCAPASITNRKTNAAAAANVIGFFTIFSLSANRKTTINSPKYFHETFTDHNQVVVDEFVKFYTTRL